MTSARPEIISTPAYAPWRTFTSFLQALKNSAIPSQIDFSVMSRMSGSAQTLVRGALRFFYLIDDAGVVQEPLRNLVNAIGTDRWQPVWSVIFHEAYHEIIGDLDTDTATLKQLADRFREKANISGSVLRKAIRFYLDGLESTGSDYSPHFKVRALSTIAGDTARSRNGRAATPRRGAAALPDTPPAKRHASLHAGPDDFVIKLPGRLPIVIPLPPDLRKSEWEFIDNQVRGFMALRAERDREQEEDLDHQREQESYR